MNQDRTKRKLTVPFCADVVGYCRLMGEDEASTVRRLEEYKKLIFTLVEQNESRIFDYWKEYGCPDLCRPSGDDDFVCD